MDRKRLFGPWGPVVIAGAAVLVFLGTAAPALADDPPTAPRAIPAPRGGRALPSGSSYEAVVTYAKDTARDLGALQQEARDVAAERIETATQISTLAALTEKPSVVRGRLDREALRLSASARVPSPITLSEPVREAADEMRTLRTELKEQYVALEAEAVAL